EPVPAGVDVVEPHELCALDRRRERPGERRLPRAGTAVDEHDRAGVRHDGVDHAGHVRHDRMRRLWLLPWRGCGRGIRSHALAQMKFQWPVASETATAVAAIAAPMMSSSTSGRPKCDARAQERWVVLPKPRASIAVASLLPRRIAITRSAKACPGSRRTR